MAYYLEFDGVDDSISAGRVTDNEGNMSSLEFVIDISPSDSLTSLSAFITIVDVMSLQYRDWVSDNVKLRVNTSSSNFVYFPSGLIANTRQTVRIRLEQVGDQVVAKTFINEVLQDTSTKTDTLTPPQRDFVLAPNVSSSKLYGLEVYKNDVIAFKYNPTLSAEAGGTLLIDEVGGNHGTLNGFSADPFVYYYDFLNPADEDTTADNCLVLPENRPNGEQLDLVAGANNSREFDLRLVFSQSNLSLLLGATSSSANHLGFRYGGDTIRLGLNWLGFTFTLNNNFNNYTDLITLEFKLTANTLTAKQDGAALAETFDVGTRGFKLPVEAFRTNEEIKAHSISFISHDFPEDSRFYDFNRSPATAPIVPELINGQNGTMIGFPEPSGPVKNASNEIIGYRFNGVDTYAQAPTIDYNGGDFSLEWEMQYLGSLTANVGVFWNGVTEAGLTLQCNLKNNKLDIDNFGSKIEVSLSSLPVPINQASKYKFVDSPSGSFLYQNDVEVASGSQLFTQGNPSIGYFNIARKYNGSNSEVNFYNAIKITHGSAVVNNWDTTLGDDDEIIDTIGGNNADIINAPTAGYLPIIEKQVFTVGGAGGVADYELNSTTILDMISSADAADAQLYLLIVENIALDNYVALREANYPAIIDGGIPFNGDFNDSVNNRIIDDTLALSRSFLCYGSWSFKNFALVGGGGYIQNPRNTTDISGVGFSKVNVYADGDIIRINNSVVTGTLDTSVGSDANNYRQLEVYNSVLAERMVIRNYSSCEFVNSISIGSTFNLDTASYVGATINVKNSRIKSSLGSIIPVDGGGNIDSLSTLDADAFNDPDNGDYRVLQTYADQFLVGQGWNGSDIGASFYFDGDSGGGYSITLTQAAFNFNGSDIGTVKDSIISISTGSANLSGEATDTLKGSLISADSGSVSISGRGVDLRRNALLTINTGSATFAGDDIGINKVTVNDVVITLDSGNALIRGVPVDLLADRRTTIETGSYALTGQDFTTKAGRKVTIGNGEATLNGQPLSIVYTPAGGYTIALATGGALLTGDPITTVADRIAQIEAGSTDLIGSVIELSAHRKINPEPGNVTLAGQKIDCLYGRAITIEPTSFSLTGAQVTLDWSGFVEVRLNGYSLRFEQSLIQPTFNQSLINMRFGA